ncbi:iron complex outermembrane receptor protein [Pedobacter africanus]|uniref:Iron complex outermembrane receptor protein n=1 Tax=Pedobacter africanus TaxID=151894 RepID=A0ACC6KYZ0_9SPHI|nr:TonB-dependent receptor [Pedobacter africanus]MDR6784357.1 iron complex outermembrane receptor protein [Pedobacter africanus]
MKYLYAATILCITLIFNQSVTAQLASAPARGSIKGKVRSNDGKPAAYVSIIIVENNRKALSDEDGTFSFNNLRNGTYTLKTSFVGLQVQSQKVTVTENETASVEFILSESSAQLDEVAISGYKSPNQKPASLGKTAIAPRDLPQAVQVIGTQIIADQQANRLGDVMKNVNGVAMGANRGSVGENFYARGYSLGANNVFKNGARTSIGGIPEASTLESVEVLKGSAALLYGGVTGGAVVNMVTKKPKFESGGEVSMRVGSYDMYKPIFDVYGPLSENIAYRMIGSYEKAGSYRDHVQSNRIYVNPSLLYKISEKTDILIQADYLKSNFTPDFGIGTVGNAVSPLGRNAFVNTAWAYNKTNTGTLQAVLNRKFSDNWKLNVTAGVQSYIRDYFSSERPFTTDGSWNRALTRSRTRELTYNEQVNLTGNLKTFGISHQLLIGGDGDQSKIITGGFTNPNLLGGSTKYYDQVNLLDPASFNKSSNFIKPETTLLTNTEAIVYRFGGFAQDLISLTDKFKVLAGIRWTFQKTPVTTINTLATQEETKGTTALKIDKAFSPKFGLIYQPLKSTSIYASYANNFTSNSGIDIATNAPMGPSIIDQYEAGIKNDFMDGKLSVNVTAYQIRNDRFAQQALFKADGSSNADANLKEFTGKTQSDGVEVDITATIVEGLNFIAGYSYNYMRYTETLPLTVIPTPTPANPNATTTVSGIVEGERLVGTTKNTANASLFYTVQNGVVKGLKLGASAFYTGDRNGGRNTNKAGSSSGIIPVKGFTTFDLSAGYTYKKFSILGKVSNISNELNYFIHENYSVNPIAPRQFSTTLTYKF